VMIAAKNDRSHTSLCRQFAERSVDKQYIAFVWGVPKERSQRIETLYGRHPRQRQKFSSKVKKGKQATTEFSVIADDGHVACLQVHLLTGRTHQIRVHMSDLGFPLVGDAVYGLRRAVPSWAPALWKNMGGALNRQALHALTLQVRHPTTNECLLFRAPLPDDLLLLAEELDVSKEL